MNYKNSHRNNEENAFTPMKILSFTEKESIVNELKDLFGIREIKGTMIMKGREKIFLFLGDFKPRELKKLENNIIIERTGVYFGKIADGGLRLSIEGTNILKEQITKNIFTLDSKQAEDWIFGRDLNIETGKKGFLVMQHNEDFLGCGKASEKKIGNFIPKARRLRERG
ncbi:MAG: hypothetical protein Q8P15_00295 [Nanoarchaeota archaeon]|nr:hypothetical protein [Nanoarchaeota archaeon]